MRSDVYDTNSAMRCKHRDSLYDTDEDIKDSFTVGNNLHLLDLHVNAQHPPARPCSPDLLFWEEAVEISKTRGRD